MKTISVACLASLLKVVRVKLHPLRLLRPLSRNDAVATAPHPSPLPANAGRGSDSTREEPANHRVRANARATDFPLPSLARGEGQGEGSRPGFATESFWLSLVSLLAVALASPALSADGTAWNDGYPLKGLKNADAFMASFKNKAQHLGKDGKLRILIIGDSLSDGGYHWSHHFRKDLQAAYGNGGLGAVWAAHAGGQPGQGFAPEWLWTTDDFTSWKGPQGRWRVGWGGRGEIWPYLGWNGYFLTTDDPQSSYELRAKGSKFTVVYSCGTFNTFDGESVLNRAAGFTVAFDGREQTIAPAAGGAPLDIGLAKFEAPEGRHTLRISGVHDGTLWLHGVIVENSAPGVVVYNISRGGYWAHDFIWRQPGWEKILRECSPDYTIIFLTKPDSGGSAPVSDTNRLYEYERLVQRVSRAVPMTRFFFFKCWDPRDGISPADAQTWKERTEWFEAKHYPYLDLQAGLDRNTMKQLGWFSDNIHLAPPGGQGIGDAIARLFLP